MSRLATTTVRQAHHVRLRHTVTGQTISPVTATIDALPPGWWMRVRGGDVVVVRRDGATVPPAPPTPPVLTVRIADQRQALLVTTPVVTVPLTSASITLDIPPVPMTLTVELRTPGTGTQRTGRTVIAQATSGATPRPSVVLIETTPGTYACAPATWTAAFSPLDLLVDGKLLRQVVLELTRLDTRLRLVDTT